MNAQQDAKEKAEVMLAFARGEEVEFSSPVEPWQSAGSWPSWNFFHLKWRIKPKARVRFLIEGPDGKLGCFAYGLQDSATDDSRGCRVVKFVEQP